MSDGGSNSAINCADILKTVFVTRNVRATASVKFDDGLYMSTRSGVSCWLGGLTATQPINHSINSLSPSAFRRGNPLGGRSIIILFL